MSGCVTLTEEEKQEMLLDACDPKRRAAFAAAQRASRRGTRDDYIEFLSENMGICRHIAAQNHGNEPFQVVSEPDWNGVRRVPRAFILPEAERPFS